MFCHRRLRELISGCWAGRRLWWQWLGVLIIGLAAGRARPGGLAFFAPSTAAVSGVLTDNLWCPLVIGILTGSYLRGMGQPIIFQLASLLVVGCAALLGRRLQVESSTSCLPVALIAGATDLLLQGMAYLFTGNSAAIFPTLISESILAALFTFPLVYALDETKPWQHELRLGLLLTLTLCGFGDLRIGLTDLREILGRVLLLIIADRRGPGWGAGIGVVLGLISGDLWQILQRIGLYAGIGFFAGLLRACGRYGVVLGFLLSSLLLSICYASPEGVAGHLMASFLAVVVFLLAQPFLLTGVEDKHVSGANKPLQVEIGFAQRAKPSEPICGDTLSIIRITPQRILLSVSDGMGAGINAARESRIVVKLLELLLMNGISPDVAAGIINTALYLRGGEESAATIDVAVADLANRSCELLKVGAPPSFWKSGGQVEMIRSLCWPAGILEQVDAEVLEREIAPGDILIMATDGITEVDGQGTVPDDWLFNYIRDLPVEEAQVIAELLVKRAWQNSEHQHSDDMSVLVARFGSSLELE